MRTLTITKELFQFDELTDAAKEKAREWFREASAWHSDYADSVIDDAADIADLFGLDIRQTRKTRMDNTHYYAPTVYYSGFCSQGDGACFEGQYRYKKGALKATKQHAPQDTELHRIVSELQTIQSRNFYRLRAWCVHRGHYQHSGCMSVDVENSEGLEVSRDTEEDITQCLRDFADWIYERLESEYEYQNADEQVDESIRINEYEFTGDGEIA